MTNPFSNKVAVQSGLIWGTIMFILMTLVFPYFEGEPITMKSIILGLVIWALAGLGFGYTLEKISKKKN